MGLLSRLCFTVEKGVFYVVGRGKGTPYRVISMRGPGTSQVALVFRDCGSMLLESKREAEIGEGRTRVMDTDQACRAFCPREERPACGRERWHEETGVTEDTGVCMGQYCGFLVGQVPQSRSRGEVHEALLEAAKEASEAQLALQGTPECGSQSGLASAGMLGSCALAPAGCWLKAALGKTKRFRLSASVGEVASGGKGSFLRYDGGFVGTAHWAGEVSEPEGL